MRLTNDEVVKLLELDMQYKYPVPTIEEFISNQYYLGRSYTDDETGETVIYDCWMEALKEIFPNNVIMMWNFFALKGPIGIGKSSIQKIIGLYILYKLACMRNIGSFAKMAITKAISFIFFNLNEKKAKKEVREFLSIMDRSPAFQALYEIEGGRKNFLAKFEIIAVSTMNNLVSHDAIFISLSEINRKDKMKKNDDKTEAEEILNESYRRITSRFAGKLMQVSGGIVLDSSDLNVDSPVERALQGELLKDKIKAYSFPKWVACPDKREFFNPDKFGNTHYMVYGGDSSRRPCILKGDEETCKVLNDDYDTFVPERIIKFPSEYLSELKADINGCLTDRYGIPLFNSSIYFDRVLVREAMSLQNYLVNDIISVEFEGPQQLWDCDNFLKAVLAIPEDTYITVGLDCATSNDKFGISICYVDDFRDVEFDNGLTRQEFTLKVPLVFGVGRKHKEKTNLSKVYNFLLKLHSIRPIKLATADRFQSEQMIQDLNLAGIKCQWLSPASNTNATEWSLVRNLIHTGRVKLCNNPTLEKELGYLQIIERKVGHPTGMNDDIAVAMCASVYSAYMLGPEMRIPPKENANKRANELLSLYDSVDGYGIPKPIFKDGFSYIPYIR